MIWGCLRGTMAKVMDSNLEVSEFELQSRKYFETYTIGKKRT